MINIDIPWQDATFIAFDTETTGKYPIESEICEIAAVKWRGGEVRESYQTLVKPSSIMSETVIKIHGITNEMVANAPSIDRVIGDFYKFIEDGVLIAHHAPFDMGFLAIEFESAKLPLPTTPVICSSLLSRRAIPESPNHRLQTLVSYLSIDGGRAHRALDDAKACLGVALKSMERVPGLKKVSDVLDYQQKNLLWHNYSMEDLLASETYGGLVEALRQKQLVEIIYTGGSKPGRPRVIHPIGIVRSPDQDFVVAQDDKGSHPKRFFLNKIKSTRMVKEA